MKIAVIGGTGFIGGHLVRMLVQSGHFPAVVARGLNKNTESLRKLPNIQMMMINMDDERKLFQTVNNCDAVVHLAGISRESQSGHFKSLHIDGTLKIVHAARKASVNRIIYVSYLNASKNGPTEYHRSKWQAEKIVKESGLGYVILRPGIVFGPGDSMISNISQALDKMPFFATVGLASARLRPLSVNDLLSVIMAAIVDDRLSNKTFAVLGPEELKLSEIVNRVSRACGKPALPFPLPLIAHKALAAILGSKSGPYSLVSPAQLVMLAEGMSKIPADCESLPSDLQGETFLTEEYIKSCL